jgi:hypothetical protein
MSSQEIHMPAPYERRLLHHAEVSSLLPLTKEQIAWLVDTRQLQPLLICGESLYDSNQIDDLINVYLKTASRRVQ